MELHHAQQIADLLNDQNKLAIKFTAEQVFNNEDQYLTEIEGDTVLGCVKVDHVQWYHTEVSHLSVIQGRRREGIGRRLVLKALEVSKPVVQGTIRASNVASVQLFLNLGFTETNRFVSPLTKNTLGIYQLVVRQKYGQVLHGVPQGTVIFPSYDGPRMQSEDRMHRVGQPRKASA